MVSADHPVALVCDVLGCSRSSYYYQEQASADAGLKEAIVAVAVEWPTYGYRRMTAELGRLGWVLNHKRVRQLMDEMGLKVKVKRKRRKTTRNVPQSRRDWAHSANSDHPFPRYPNLVLSLVMVHPDQVWVACQLPLAHHLRAPGTRLRLHGGDHGRVHPRHPGLEPEPQPGRKADPDRAAKGLGRA